MSDTATTDIIIDYARPGRSTRVDITVRCPDGGTKTDRINVTSIKAREKFADLVCAWREGLDRDAIIARLEQIASEVTKPADPKAHSVERTDATRAIEMADGVEGIELFHTPDGEAFATITIAGHRETWRVNHRGFREWLSRQFYTAEGKAIGSEALQNAINTLAGIAKFEGKEYQVHLRLAEHDGFIYLDLCDAEWRVVKIGPEGWDLIPGADCPVRFTRRPAMEALPVPTRGGSLNDLRPLMNIPDDNAWHLVTGWLVGAMRPTGPYGVLAVNGEQGSAKSTLCKMLRRMIDPSAADLRRPPKDERDAFIAASNSWVCSYNNISGLKIEISDALCALATDGGFATRTLYADDDETVFRARRPVLLNGITELASRPDLLDRMLTLSLLPIPEEKRRDEEALWAEYERVRPGALGGLLDAICAALRNRGKVKLDRLPRLADLALWVTGAEEGLGWETGTFAKVFGGNRAEAHGQAVEASPIGPTLLNLIDDCTFIGTATDLLAALNRKRGDRPAPTGWPESPKGLSDMLRRLASNLRGLGMFVDIPTKGKGKHKKKEIRLEWPGNGPPGGEPSAKGPPNAPPNRAPSSRAAASSRTQPKAGGSADGADRADGSRPTQSGRPDDVCYACGKASWWRLKGQPGWTCDPCHPAPLSPNVEWWDDIRPGPRDTAASGRLDSVEDVGSVDEDDDLPPV